MRITRTAAAVALALLLQATATSGSALGAATINGIASQGGNWQWSSGGALYASLMGAKYRHARYNAPWNVAQQPAASAAWQATNNWIQSATAQGKSLLISFNNANSCRDSGVAAGVPCTPGPPTETQFRSALAAFRAQWPQVRAFTAWNEPNHSVIGDRWDGAAWHHDAELTPIGSPTLAASYFRALQQSCAGGSCTAVAGDFSDGSGSMGSYVTSYRNQLTTWGITPSRWAVHAYSAVNNGANGWISTFMSTIAGRTETWLTEVGVKVCDAGLAYPGDAAQVTAAERLVELISAYNFARSYYYMLEGSQTPANCPGSWDSGLLQKGSGAVDAQPRWAFRVLYPELAGRSWAMRNANSAGATDAAVVFSQGGAPLAGDWNADGRDTPGTFQAGSVLWSLRNTLSSGGPQTAFQYGFSDGIPVVGDWNGDGVDTPGLFRASTATWYLSNSLGGTVADLTFSYGFSSGVPVVGDWDGDGDDTVGIVDVPNSHWYLRNTNDSGVSTVDFTYGFPGGVPFSGDWDGNGTDTPGMYQASTAQWFLRNSNSTGVGDVGFTFGVAGDSGIAVGDWDGNGTDTPAIVR
ncbi:MAG TPA: hypothetical protein VF250_10775 [Conexibacter sp.]